MSNIKTDYALFDVVDYKGESKLSSYNLDITPLTFKARIPEEKGTDIPLNDQKVTLKEVEYLVEEKKRLARAYREKTGDIWPL